MKKFFSFVCALALVMSASATPLQHASQKASSKSLFKHQTLAVSAEKPMFAAAPKRAPQAAQAGLDLSNEILTVSCEYYSNAAFSQPGAYDYYFEFAGAEGAYYQVPEPYVTVDLYLPTNTGLVPGTYTLANGDLDAPLLCLEEMDYVYAYYGMDVYEIVDATLIIASSRTGVYDLTLVLTDSDNLEYTIRKTGVALNVTENTYDPNNGGGGSTGGNDDLYDYSFEPTQATTINFAATSYNFSDYMEDYGEVLVQLGGTDYKLVIEMFLSNLDANGNIPAGTYQVSNSGADNTVLASPGGDEQYDYGTFVMGGFNAAGQYTLAYYVVSGTLTVSYNAAGEITIALQGTSYNGSTINVTYTGATVALHDVEAVSATKRLLNGQLLIEKNGVLYNAVGAVVE